MERWIDITFPCPVAKGDGRLGSSEISGLGSRMHSVPFKRMACGKLKNPGDFVSRDILGEFSASEESEAITGRILDSLLDVSAPGIVKILGLPAPNIEDEEAHRNNLVNQVLKKSLESSSSTL